MLEILKTTADYCVVNKPFGYVVHRTPGAEKFPALLQTLRDQVGKHVYPVHRLDRGTSGCITFAFSPEATKEIQAALESDKSKKRYHALCLGGLPDSGQIDRPLTNEKKEKQDALTHFKVIERILRYDFVELEISTGRQHQIRRHLSHLKSHIIGDVNHGKGWLNRKFREDYDFHRLFLHCSDLCFEAFGKELELFVQTLSGMAGNKL